MSPAPSLACLIAALSVAAPDAGLAGRMAAAFHGSAHQLRLAPPRVARGPVLDGALDDPVWKEAAVLDSFTNYEPVEGVRDTLGTECLVLYDARNLYVGFRCTDDPRGVRAPLVPRDEASDDFVGVEFDTYNDRRRSILFASDPNGIQSDGVFPDEAGEPDLNPDFQFTSRGRRTATGYEVEMAIPFRSLRFPPRDSLTFGFVAFRQVARLGVLMFWAPLTRNLNSLHAQYGALQDITGVHPGRDLQLNPTWTGTRASERGDAGALRHANRSRAGIGIKAGLTSNLVADVAVTPDFSQVEADAGVVDINQRFAIFYPEKRPFFLEGSDLFGTPLNLVYTRRIADPLFGVKLTGKVGRSQVGALTAEDRSGGESIETLPDRLNPYFGHDALFDIVRLRHDVRRNSHVGLLVGNREQQETYNRGLGFDGRFTLGEKYTLTLQRVQSWSRERDLRAAVARLDPAERLDLDPDLLELQGAIREGYASKAELARGSRALEAGLSFQDISPHFAADMGFLERTDLIESEAWCRPHFYPKPGSWLTRVTPEIEYERTFRHGDRRWAGRLSDEVVQAGLDLDFPRSTWASARVERVFTLFDGREFPDQRRFALDLGSDRYRAARGEVSLGLGDGVVFEETVPGRERTLSASLRIRFSERVDTELDLNGSIVERRETGTRFADLAISRLKLSFLADPRLSFRWIGQYRSERDYDVAGDPREGKRELSLDLLASYFVRPGTVAYLGYGARLEGAAARGMTPRSGNLFTKIGYLWQL